MREARVLRCAFECFARTVFRTYVRLEVGARDILPAGSFLLCSNHASHLDGAALMVASGLPFDSFRLLAAADYFSPESRAGRLTRAMGFGHPTGQTMIARIRSLLNEAGFGRGRATADAAVVAGVGEPSRDVVDVLMPCDAS